MTSTNQTKLGDLTLSSNLITPIFKDLNDPTNFFLHLKGDSILADVYLKPNASSTQTGSFYAEGDVCINSTGSGTGTCLSTLAGGGGGGAGGGSNGSVVFAGGSDGDVVLGSNMTLDRDYHFNNLTINSGVTLNTNGYRLLVANTLVNNGTIVVYSGAIGTLATGTVGGVGAWSGTNRRYGQPCSGSPATPCTAGTSGTGMGGNGGRAGVGCNGGSMTSENLQVVKQAVPSLQGLVDGAETQVTSYSNLYYMIGSASTNGVNLSGGAGGGGGSTGTGCGNTWGGRGGSGGQGGGAMLVAAQTLNNNGTITAPGSGGGNSSGYYGLGDGTTGGGGGGGGGTILLIYKTLNNLGTVTAPGGAGGWSCGGYYGRSTPCSVDGYVGSSGNIYRAKIM